MHYHKRAQTLNPMSQTTPLIRQLKVHIYLATYRITKISTIVELRDGRHKDRINKVRNGKGTEEA